MVFTKSLKNTLKMWSLLNRKCFFEIFMLLGLPGSILTRVNFDHLKHKLKLGGGLTTWKQSTLNILFICDLRNEFLRQILFKKNQKPKKTQKLTLRLWSSNDIFQEGILRGHKPSSTPCHFNKFFLFFFIIFLYFTVCISQRLFYSSTEAYPRWELAPQCFFKKTILD